jgi:hypothetical protein
VSRERTGHRGDADVELFRHLVHCDGHDYV